MAVSSTTTQTSVTLTTAEQTVATGFAFFSSEDVKVLDVEADALLIEGTDYEVTGGNGSTGNVVFLEDGPSSGPMIIYRSIAPTQPEDYTDGGPLPPSSIERGLDRLCYLIQQLASDVGRVLRVSISSGPQDPITIGDTPGLVGTDGLGSTALLTVAQVVDMLDLPIGNKIERPVRTWASASVRATLTPDFLGQIGVQQDALASPFLGSLWVGTALTQGAWAQVNITPESLPNNPYMLRAVHYLTTGTNADFTPNAAARALRVTCVGAGGGGGGAAIPGSGEAAVGSGGGGGGMSQVFLTDMSQVWKYTVGVGGTGGVGSASGNNGGNTTFFGGASGTTERCRANGGGGGGGGVAAATSVLPVAGGAGGSTVGAVGSLTVRGHTGGHRGVLAVSGTARILSVSNGGASAFGAPGGAGQFDGDGQSGGGAGGGGGGCGSEGSGSTRTGGAGGAGLIIIEEYL